MEPGGLISPCCVNIYPIGTSTGQITKDMNCEGLVKVRQNFLQNKIPYGCDVCYADEANGHVSMRQKFAERFPNLEKDILKGSSSGILENPQIKYLDVRWSNICNFKCRFCGFGLSSSWAPDLVERHGKFEYVIDHLGNKRIFSKSDPILRTDVDFEDLKRNILPHLEYIHFLGGEPLLMEEFYQILDLLREMGRTDLDITIVTNLSQLEFKGKNLFEALEGFQRCSLSISLDGYGAPAEYMRKGTKWERLRKNIDRMQDYVDAQNFKGREFNLQAFHTVYALNAFHTVDFYEYMKTFFRYRVQLNTCHNPNFLRLDVLPPAVKNDVLNLYQKHATFYAPLIKQLTEDKQDYYTNHFLEFIKEVGIMDRIRGEDFLTTFPEFRAYPDFRTIEKYPHPRSPKSL